MSVSFVWPSTVQITKRKSLQSCQISGVKWTNGGRDHVKFLAFENWLGERFRYLQCVCYWDTDLNWAINLYRNCWIKQSFRSRFVQACCLRATGHRPVCTHLQTTRLSLKYLVAFHLTSLEMQNIITESGLDKTAVIFQTTSYMHFCQSRRLHFYQYFAQLYSHGANVLEKNNLLKICCPQILDSLEQKLWNVQIICIHFSQCCILRCSFGCHSEGLSLNHNNVGMRCNEGSNVKTSNWCTIINPFFCKTIAFAGIHKIFT